MSKNRIVKRLVCLVLSASMSFIPITVKAEKDYDEDEIWAEIQTWDDYTEEKPREVWGLGDAWKHDATNLTSNFISDTAIQYGENKAESVAIEKVGDIADDFLDSRIKNPKKGKKAAGVVSNILSAKSAYDSVMSVAKDDFVVNNNASLNSLLGGATVLSAVMNGLSTFGLAPDMTGRIATVADLAVTELRNGNVDRAIDSSWLAKALMAPINGVAMFMGGDGWKDLPMLMQSLGEAIQGTIDFKNDMAQIMQEALSHQKVGRTVGAYKPVIYFYNAQGKDITVKFPHEELLTETIPEYNGRWAVKTNDSDRIISADGKEYPNLYYESITYPSLFDTRKGFYINKEDRADEFNSILSEYGFNELEIKEFIDFWDGKLDDTDYMMYPQYTDTVNIAMPIEVNPIPDNIVRIWFVFEQADNIDYQNAEIEPFMREGYTMIEWGGVILDE